MHDKICILSYAEDVFEESPDFALFHAQCEHICRVLALTRRKSLSWFNSAALSILTSSSCILFLRGLRFVDVGRPLSTKMRLSAASIPLETAFSIADMASSGSG
jgi:hypothetical protein